MHRSVGEWCLAFVSVFDFLITAISNLLYGSIPSIKKGAFMVKFNLKRMIKHSDIFLSHWVTKATFLALGLWLLPPRPYAHLLSPTRRSRGTR